MILSDISAEEIGEGIKTRLSSLVCLTTIG